VFQASPHPWPPVRVVGALVATLALTGCMAKPAPEPMVETRELNVPAMGAVEVNFEMEKGAEVAVTVNADRSVSWDIHSHPEGLAVMKWREGDAREMNVTFTAALDAVYSVYVMSGVNASRVEVGLRGAFEIVG